MYESFRKSVLGVCLAAVLAFSVAGEATAQLAALPKGKSVGNLKEAKREATPTRERIFLAGLWQWQPAGKAIQSVPADGWGHLQGPSPWPGGGGRGAGRGGARGGGPSFHPNPAWDAGQLRKVTAAWHQVEVTVPTDGTGRRVALTTEFLNSFASVYVDGGRVADMRFPAGEVDLTALCRPGEKHVPNMRSSTPAWPATTPR